MKGGNVLKLFIGMCLPDLIDYSLHPLLQNATLIRNATKVYYTMFQAFYYIWDSFITKCDRYYKSKDFFRRSDSYHKLWRLLPNAPVHCLISFLGGKIFQLLPMLHFTWSQLYFIYQLNFTFQVLKTLRKWAYEKIDTMNRIKH